MVIIEMRLLNRQWKLTGLHCAGSHDSGLGDRFLALAF